MPDTPFSAQMLLLYSNTFLVMVQFTLVQPTAGTYAAWFTGSTKLGGTDCQPQFGSAILQIRSTRCATFRSRRSPLVG